MPTINMRSQANKVKGQGVGACYDEQVALVKNGLSDDFKIYINSLKTCDIMHYHTVNFRYFIEILFRGRKSKNIGYVHFLPDTLDESLKLNWLYRKVFYKYLLTFYNSMDYLITVNPNIIEKIYSYNITKPKVLCIPNFVSKENFYPIENLNVNILRAKFGLARKKFTILGVGQLQTRKGVFDFIETAKLTPDVNFVWAGGFSFGKLTDGYDKIRKIVENPPANVKFLGIIDRSLMNELYNCTDMLLLPSFDELFPMTILEALSCGKPVLLRDIPVYNEILFDHYIKAFDAQGFSEQIQKVASDKTLYSYWAKQADICSSKYSEIETLKLWQNLYETVYSEKLLSEKVVTEGNL